MIADTSQSKVDQHSMYDFTVHATVLLPPHTQHKTGMGWFKSPYTSNILSGLKLGHKSGEPSLRFASSSNESDSGASLFAERSIPLKMPLHARLWQHKKPTSGKPIFCLLLDNAMAKELPIGIQVRRIDVESLDASITVFGNESMVCLAMWQYQDFLIAGKWKSFPWPLLNMTNSAGHSWSAP